MNNYEKLKTLCHENYIGSEKCGRCDGNGWKQTDIIAKNGAVKIDCQTCKGKGYIIPLEFGCEVKNINNEKTGVLIRKSKESNWHSIVWKKEGVRKITETHYSDYENLGKPLSLQDVLRLLGSIEDDNGHETILEHYGNGDVGFYVNSIKIDLTKDIKDQDESVLQAIIDIVK